MTSCRVSGSKSISHFISLWFFVVCLFHFRKDLDLYFQTLPANVRLIRSQKRLGLIRARTLGAEYASGEVLIFLDSHCEATPGWAEPILYRIQQKYDAVLCPVIDAISHETLDYHGGSGIGAVGSFHWTLDFVR